MAYIEFTGPPACGKTSAASEMLEKDPLLAAGRRSLASAVPCRSVNRLGLPPEGVSTWRSIVCALPSGLILSLRYWRHTGQFRQARALLVLLLKCRALAESSSLWVIDQGLQQHILSAVAGRLLTPHHAMYWRKLCLEGPWRPQQLIELTASPDELISRIKGSIKHTRQCGGETPEEYVARHVGAFGTQGTAAFAGAAGTPEEISNRRGHQTHRRSGEDTCRYRTR